MEEVAFGGVILRHRDYIDAKKLSRATAFSEADRDVWEAEFKKCCELIVGHDPSRGRNRAMPEPVEMLQDVEVLNGWVKSLKERQNNIP